MISTAAGGFPVSGCGVEEVLTIGFGGATGCEDAGAAVCVELAACAPNGLPRVAGRDAPGEDASIG